MSKHSRNVWESTDSSHYAEERVSIERTRTAKEVANVADLAHGFVKYIHDQPDPNVEFDQAINEWKQAREEITGTQVELTVGLIRMCLDRWNASRATKIE